MADAPPPDRKQRLIEESMRLFWEKGYQSTSVADILREADAHSGSLYHFFETKQDLLVAVLEQYRDGIHPMLLDPAWGGCDDPIERVFALMASYRQLLVTSDFRLGCPIGNLALEIAEPDPPVRTAIQANFEAWTEAVAGCLEEAGDRLPDDVDRTELARFVLTTMEGGVMLARTYGSIAPFDQGIRHLRDYVHRLEETARRAG